MATLRRQAGTAEDRVGHDPDAAAGLLRHIAVHSALEHALTTDPALAGVTGDELTAAATRFQQVDDQHLHANAFRVRRAAAARLRQALDEHPDQHALVKREVTRKRGHQPVRKLFEQAPEVMGALKPVWAMSPLQVSRLLPAAACFDVVIFDEASQIKPADAIPALLRAPQVIVAGDSRQLPPTEFFTKVLEDPPDRPPTTAAPPLAKPTRWPSRPQPRTPTSAARLRRPRRCGRSRRASPATPSRSSRRSTGCSPGRPASCCGTTAAATND